MVAATVWTPELDAIITAGRARGDTWDDIAVALGFSRCSVIGRARHIGVVSCPLPSPLPLLPPTPRRPRIEPLPAGHPTSWDLITAGTLLHGTRYEGSKT